MIGIGLAPVYARPSNAPLATLKRYSSCANELPKHAQQWDVSGFVVFGQCVEHHTIRAFLGTIDRLAQGSPSPTAHTMIGLAQLLGFADAVGASLEVVLAIDATASAAAGLAAEVRILGGSRYTIGLRGGVPFYEADGDIWQLRSTGCPTASSIAEASKVVAQQAEALLYLAYKLQLPQLKQLMLSFLNTQWVLDGQALDGALLAAGVGSERVMEAAGATHGCHPFDWPFDWPLDWQSNADSASCSKAQLHTL